jgi:hypothetical protein
MRRAIELGSKRSNVRITKVIDINEDKVRLIGGECAYRS